MVSESMWSVKQGFSLLLRPACGFVPEKSPQPTAWSGINGDSLSSHSILGKLFCLRSAGRWDTLAMLFIANGTAKYVADCLITVACLGLVNNTCYCGGLTLASSQVSMQPLCPSSPQQDGEKKLKWRSFLVEIKTGRSQAQVKQT